MKYVARFDGDEREFVFEQTAAGLIARCGERTYALDLSLVGDGSVFSALIDGQSHDVVADIDGSSVTLQMDGERFVVAVEDERERAAHAVAGNKAHGKRELRASMPGIVVDVKVEAGSEVQEGDALVVLEAMKMQNPLVAEAPGVVTKVHCKRGEAVAAGALLVELE